MPEQKLTHVLVPIEDIEKRQSGWNILALPESQKALLLKYPRINPASQQQRIEDLEKHLKILVDGYEQWEADIISENILWWPHAEKDAVRGKLYDDMLKLQEQRNRAKQALTTKQ